MQFGSIGRKREGSAGKRLRMRFSRRSDFVWIACTKTTRTTRTNRTAPGAGGSCAPGTGAPPKRVGPVHARRGPARNLKKLRAFAPPRAPCFAPQAGGSARARRGAAGIRLLSASVRVVRPVRGSFQAAGNGNAWREAASGALRAGFKGTPCSCSAPDGRSRSASQALGVPLCAWWDGWDGTGETGETGETAAPTRLTSLTRLTRLTRLTSLTCLTRPTAQVRPLRAAFDRSFDIKGLFQRAGRDAPHTCSRGVPPRFGSRCAFPSLQSTRTRAHEPICPIVHSSGRVGKCQWRPDTSRAPGAV